VAAWLWGIASRRLIDGLRRCPPPLVPLDRVPEQVADGGYDAGLVAGEVGALIGRLPTVQREVARAAVLDGLTMRETASRLGIPEGTAKTRMMRARRGLRALMTEEVAA
jgi:RNA polymerase sigma-70 factor (ECF subfamily)